MLVDASVKEFGVRCFFIKKSWLTLKELEVYPHMINQIRHYTVAGIYKCYTVLTVLRFCETIISVGKKPCKLGSSLRDQNRDIFLDIPVCLGRLVYGFPSQ